MMTWAQIAERIAKMTPEQRSKPAGIAMLQTGEIAHADEICLAEDFNGQSLPDHHVLMYDSRADYP